MSDAKVFTTLKVVTWAFLVVTPIAYLGIAQFLDTNLWEAEAGNELLMYILLIVAVVTPAAAPLVERVQIQLYRSGKSGHDSPARLFLTLSIIRMAMVEATYVYSFVVFIITGVFTNMLYFYPIGIFWSLVHWPRRVKYEQLLEKLNRP